MSVTPAELIREARKLVGVKYKHQGRSLAGVDCIGLVALAALNAGVDVFAVSGIRDRRNYARKPDPAMFALIEQHCRPIAEPVPGCMIFFRFAGDSHPRHLGLYSDTDTLIHAESKSRSCVVEHGYRAQWVRWTDSLWLLPGVNYV